MNLASVKSLFRNHRRSATLVSLALAAVLVFTAFRLGRSDGVQYFTAPVEQGEILTVVNATGTIDAVTTVEVGSQVSGMIEALHADFNSEVKKGQIVAQIDPAPFRARVVQAQADLASALAYQRRRPAVIAKPRPSSPHAGFLFGGIPMTSSRRAVVYLVLVFLLGGVLGSPLPGMSAPATSSQ